MPVSVGEKSEREVFRLGGGGWLFSSPKSQHTAKGRGGLLHCALAADISGENEARDVFGVKFARLPKVTTEAALERNPWNLKHCQVKSEMQLKSVSDFIIHY